MGPERKSELRPIDETERTRHRANRSGHWLSKHFSPSCVDERVQVRSMMRTPLELAITAACATPGWRASPRRVYGAQRPFGGQRCNLQAAGRSYQ